MSSMQTTICIRSWTILQAPGRCWSRRRRSGEVRGHMSTTRMPPLPHNPYLKILNSKSIPNDRINRLIGVGSEEILFNAAITAAEAKTMNSLKNLRYFGLNYHGSGDPSHRRRPRSSTERSRQRTAAEHKSRKLDRFSCLLKEDMKMYIRPPRPLV